MSHTISEIIERWVETQEYPQLSMYPNVGSWNYNVFAEDNTLYSYGWHFPLAIKLDWGYLLNGDRFSATTSRHQAILRRVMNTGSGNNWNVRDRPMYPHTIIPFAALNASSIKPESVELIDAEPDRWVSHRRRLNDEELKRQGLVFSDDRSLVGQYAMNTVYKYGVRGEWTGETEPVRNFLPRWDLTVRDGKVYEERNVHQLGESLIKAKVRTRRRNDTWDGWRYRTAHFISAWDNQDTNTYFFSELPHEVGSLEAAYEALKPQTVKFGEFEDRFIVRQGDIFAVETDYTTRELKQMGGSEVKRMDYVHQTNHVVTEQITLPSGAILGRGVLWHKPEGRAADHRRQVIGKKWSVIVKNTVPTTKKRRGRR